MIGQNPSSETSPRVPIAIREPPPRSPRICSTSAISPTTLDDVLHCDSPSQRSVLVRHDGHRRSVALKVGQVVKWLRLGHDQRRFRRRFGGQVGLATEDEFRGDSVWAYRRCSRADQRPRGRCGCDPIGGRARGRGASRPGSRPSRRHGTASSLAGSKWKVEDAREHRRLAGVEPSPIAVGGQQAHILAALAEVGVRRSRPASASSSTRS